jgi:hypothetical protein
MHRRPGAGTPGHRFVGCQASADHGSRAHEQCKDWRYFRGANDPSVDSIPGTPPPLAARWVGYPPTGQDCLALDRLWAILLLSLCCSPTRPSGNLRSQTTLEGVRTELCLLLHVAGTPRPLLDGGALLETWPPGQQHMSGALPRRGIYPPSPPPMCYVTETWIKIFQRFRWQQHTPSREDTLSSWWLTSANQFLSLVAEPSIPWFY